MSASLSFLLRMLFWAIVLGCLIGSVIPFFLTSRARIKGILLAAAANICLFIIYDTIMPVEMNIRVDWLLMIPLFIGELAVGAYFLIFRSGT